MNKTTKMSKRSSENSTVTLPSSVIVIGVIAGMWAILVILSTLFSNLSETGDTHGWLQIMNNANPARKTCSIKPLAGSSCSGSIPSGCTVFTVSKGEQVFFGGNDDWTEPDSFYWVDPGDGENYGAIWIGTPDNVQQGVNEKGLAYDGNSLPRVDTNPHPEREQVSGGYTSYPIHILHECATVEEVIEWVNTHQWRSYMHDQMQFADASGDAVIISAGADAEVVFTRKPSGNGYLVSTNFNVANPANGYGYPCWRYDTATERLSELVNQEGELTVQDATAVLDAVHVERGTSWTIESLIADLPNRRVYLYSYHQFDKPLELNVAEEIANPPAPGPLSRRFPEEVQQEAARRYQQARANQDRCTQIGKIWISFVIASLVLMIGLSFKNKSSMVFWLPVVLILGPLGLLVWLAIRRQHNISPRQTALVEAAGDVVPIVLAYMVILALIFFFPSSQSNELLQILFIFSLPLLFEWLFFQGALLALTTQKDYLRMLGQRLLPAWVAANLGMAGINTLSAPLVNWISNTCSIIPMSLWTVLSMWAIVVAGTIVAIPILMLYESWSVRHGFRAWSTLADGDGKVSTPTRRMLWWWFLLSFVVLFGGIIASAWIQQLLQ